MWTLEPPGKTVLDDRARAQLTVLFRAIFPGDAERRIPDAVRGGAVEYVDQLLSRSASTYEEIPDWRALYPVLLAALDDVSQARWGEPLAELDTPRATELLADLESDALSEFPSSIDQRTGFETLRRHCLQGCFCDPRWGGNPDGVMWRWFGYIQPAEEVES